MRGLCVVANGVHIEAVLLKFPHGVSEGGILGLTAEHQGDEDLVAENDLTPICLDDGGCSEGIHRCRSVRAKFGHE